MSGLNRVLFGTGMFGLGAFAGYFVSKKLLGEQYRMDVADIQAFYKEKLDELGVMEEGYEPPEEPEDSDEDDEDDEDDEEDDGRQAPASKSHKEERHRVIVDYTKKYNKPSLEVMKQVLREGASVVVPANGEEYLGDIDTEENEEYTPRDDPEYEAELEKMADEYARRRSENMVKGEPYLIEPEEYHEGPEDYDRQALYYYAKDRTLCEDDDQQVENEEECVGFDYEDKLDMQTTCWVRNDKLRVLYEIHRIDESYQKAVLGVSETPREREFRLQGRRKQALDEQPIKSKGSKKASVKEN